LNFLDRDKVEGTFEERIIALKRIMNEIAEQAETGGGRGRSNTSEMNLADRMEQMERKMLELADNLEEKEAELRDVQEQRMMQ
jgi:hypothetical protein